MLDADRYRLLYDPYRPPRCRVGSFHTCALRGKFRVAAISDALIQWPVTWQFPSGAGRLLHIVCSDLLQSTHPACFNPVDTQRPARDDDGVCRLQLRARLD